MIKFTEQEKKIILIKYIIHGTSPYAEAPLETRVKMLKVASQTIGIEYNDKEFQELGMAILSVQQKTNDAVANMLRHNKDLYQTVLHSLGSGNEEIISVVDKVLDGGLKKLGLRK